MQQKCLKQLSCKICQVKTLASEFSKKSADVFMELSEQFISA